MHLTITDAPNGLLRTTYEDSTQHVDVTGEWLREWIAGGNTATVEVETTREERLAGWHAHLMTLLDQAEPDHPDRVYVIP